MVRPHLALKKDAPIPRDVQRAGRMLSLPILNRVRSDGTAARPDQALNLRDDALYDLARQWSVVDQCTTLASDDGRNRRVLSPPRTRAQPLPFWLPIASRAPAKSRHGGCAAGGRCKERASKFDVKGGTEAVAQFDIDAVRLLQKL
jgi:hypothetical protein